MYTSTRNIGSPPQMFSLFQKKSHVSGVRYRVAQTYEKSAGPLLQVRFLLQSQTPRSVAQLSSIRAPISRVTHTIYRLYTDRSEEDDT